MSVKTLSAAVIAAATFAMPAISRADQPSPTEVKQLLIGFAQSRGVSPIPSLEIRAVVGCYPMIEHPASDVICLVDGRNGEESFDVKEVPLSKKSSGWSLLDVEGRYSPACPSKADATALLRKSLADSGTEVIDLPDEGDFTDDRGMNRDKKGPMRLMCVYGVTGALGERTVVGYFRYENGAYLIDPDREIWID